MHNQYRMIFFTFLTLLLFGCSETMHRDLLPVASRAQAVTRNYRSVRKILVWESTRRNPISFYCGCKFDIIGKKSRPKGKIDKHSCLYRPVTKSERLSSYIQWEHVVPASWLGGHRPCWSSDRRSGKSGREYCGDTDPEYGMMESDLHNLRPAIGELNLVRSDKAFADLNTQDRPYGCEFSVNREYVHPRKEIRGDIARTHLYMENQYQTNWQSDEYHKMLLLWSEVDPPDEWERERNGIIYNLQGVRNRFLD